MRSGHCRILGELWVNLLGCCAVAAAAATAAAADRCSRPDSGESQECRPDRGFRNRIVIENSLKGSPSTDWDINGAGDPTIQGFATDISRPAGARIDFKIRTPASSYRIDIYRMGYYQGHGARLVATVLPDIALPRRQPECRFEEESLLIDCGNWEVSAHWEIPEEAVSGIYFARLIRTDSEESPQIWRADHSPVRSDPKFSRPGVPWHQAPDLDVKKHAYGSFGSARRNALKEARASHIYFVVRDDHHRSDVLVQTLDTTWQAYNCWGSTNTYGVPCDQHELHAGSPAPPNTSRRAFKASYNRPFATRAYRAVNMPFNAEYPLVRWLERNGYDVSYWTGVDADRFGHLLLDATSQHRAYITIGHDEYWSGRQRQNIAKARDHGLNLMFLSGNEMYWRVRWEEDADGIDHRTLVVYKETQSLTKIDPDMDEWTGTFRDARDINPLGGWPENELTGTIFTVNAWRDDFLEVPDGYGLLRFWRNTSLALQQEGSAPVVIPVPGLLGHEWDEDIDNGWRPAGLMRLSKTVVDNVQYLQDQGATFDAGTATHRLTMYRSQGAGGLVFGAGTVQWSWGLDGHHDLVTGLDLKMGQNCYTLRVSKDQFVGNGNRDIQQATMNVLSDMDVVPMTPQLELVPSDASSDSEAPSLEGPIVAEFDAANHELILSGKVVDHGGGVAAAVEIFWMGAWHPASTLALRTGTWTYKVPAQTAKSPKIDLRIADDSGNIAVFQNLLPNLQ